MTMMMMIITIKVLIVKQIENDAKMLAGWVVVTYFRKDLGYLCLPLYVAQVVLEPTGRSIHDRWFISHS